MKLTLVIRTKLAEAILGGGLFGGNVLPAHCPCGRKRQVVVYCIQRRCHFVTFLEDRFM